MSGLISDDADIAWSDAWVPRGAISFPYPSRPFSLSFFKARTTHRHLTI
jgi:hypothetical protein